MQVAPIAKVVLARKLVVDKWFDPPAQTASMQPKKTSPPYAKMVLKRQLGKGGYGKGKGRDRYQPYRGNGKGNGKGKGPSHHLPASRQARDDP